METTSPTHYWKSEIGRKRRTMVENFNLWYYDVRSSVGYTLEQLMHGITLKTILATMLTFFTDTLYGNVTVLNIYLLVVFIDLFLGIVRAKIYGGFKPQYMFRWFRKLATHLFVVVLFGLLSSSMFHTMGITFSIVNWMLFCCTLTESASIVCHLQRLGCPIPIAIDKILSMLRKRAAQHLTSGINDPALRKEIEVALGEQRGSGDDKQGSDMGSADCCADGGMAGMGRDKNPPQGQ